MKKGLPALAGAALLLAVFTFAACGPPVQGLYHLPTFNKKNVENSSMAVVGVTCAAYELDRGQRSLYANILGGEIQNEWERMQVTPATIVSSKVGPGQLNSILEVFRESGVLQKNQCAQLQQALPGVRYAVVARIEQNEVGRHIGNTNHPPPKKFDKKDKKWIIEGPGSIVTTYTTTRTASISFSVYELDTGQLAWHGSLTQGQPRSNSYTTYYDPRDSKEQNYANSMAASAAQGPREYPSPATLLSVVQTIFGDFAAQMLNKAWENTAEKLLYT